MARTTEQLIEVEPAVKADAAPTAVAVASSLAPSLPEAHRTIPIALGLGWFRKILAFAGPGYLVAVGYMDPGNWATDLGGGAKFGYTLLSVILLSNLMAMLLQALSAKLGIVTGRDLAQACRESYSKPASLALWVICEIAIAACEVFLSIADLMAMDAALHDLAVFRAQFRRVQRPHP